MRGATTTTTDDEDSENNINDDTTDHEANTDDGYDTTNNDKNKDCEAPTRRDAGQHQFQQQICQPFRLKMARPKAVFWVSQSQAQSLVEAEVQHMVVHQ